MNTILPCAQALLYTGFSSIEFVKGVKKRRYQAIVGIPKNRLMDNGKAIQTITSKIVYLIGRRLRY